MKETKPAILSLLSLLAAIFLILPLLSAESYFTVKNGTKTDSLSIYTINDIEYVDLGILLSVTGMTSTYKKSSGEMRIENDKSYAVIYVNNPFFRSAGNVYKIEYAPILSNDLIMLPRLSVKELFSRLLSSKTVFSDSSVLLDEKSALKDVLVSDSTLCLLFTSIPQYIVEQTSRDIIFFLKNTAIDETKFKLKNQKGLLRVLEPVNEKDEATLILTYAPDFSFVKSAAVYDTLKLFFRKREKTDTLNNVSSLKTIIIDAGHGGKDPGAIGPTGLKEKIVTLEIAQKLEKLIKDSYKNLDVVLTRKDDKYVSLKERTQLANKYPNALFISIHCNASHNKESKGMETYFLSTAKTDWERAVEARENSSLTFDLPETEKKGLDFILWDLAQNEFLSESSLLAEKIQGEYEINSNVSSRGLKQAGFFVLKGNYMPAVLVETAFISNKSEEKKLKEKTFRQELAQLIFNGLRKYIKDYEKKCGK